MDEIGILLPVYSIDDETTLLNSWKGMMMTILSADMDVGQEEKI